MHDRGSQRAWSVQHGRRVRELAQLNAGALRLVGAAAALRDGNGIRGVRRGCYSLRDLRMLAELGLLTLPPARIRRMNELEMDVLPLSSERTAEILAVQRRIDAMEGRRA